MPNMQGQRPGSGNNPQAQGANTGLPTSSGQSAGVPLAAPSGFGQPTAAAMAGAQRPTIVPGGGGAPLQTGGPSSANTLPASFGRASAAGRGPGSTRGILDAQFGTGGFFDPTASNFGDIERFAQQAMQRALDRNLAATRQRFGASGFGNSARQALLEGQAIGDAASQLGGTLANLREGARQSDLSRAMQGILGAGQIDLSRQQFQQQLPFQALQGLAQLGTGLLATGQAEQVPAFLQALMPFLTGFGQTDTFGKGRAG